MGLNEKSYQQVKNILNRLDRNIDELRAARVNPAPVGSASQARLDPPAQTIPPSQPAQTLRPGQPARATPISPANQSTPLYGGSAFNGNSKPSPFGKATPILPKHN